MCSPTELVGVRLDKYGTVFGDVVGTWETVEDGEGVTVRVVAEVGLPVAVAVGVGDGV